MSPVGQFSAEHEKSLDDKGRVIVPAAYRQAAAALDEGEGVWLTRGFDGCIKVYTPKSYRVQADRVAALAASPEQKKLMFARVWLASATHVVPDGQGRIPVPQGLRDATDITSRVVFVGLQTHFEIWAVEKWAALKADVSKNFDAIGREVLGTGAVGTTPESNAGESANG
jgi:MraZ protein